MNISGIRPNEGFYEINTIKKNVISSVQSAEPKVTERPSMQQDSQINVAQEAISQNYGSYDYAKQYQPNETFRLKGEASDLKSLDVEQAISTMQKDQVIQQYQYFVGESRMQNHLEQVKIPDKAMEDFTIL